MKVQHPLDWKLPRKPVRRDVAPMGEVYSHLSEEERQVIQIEIGNGTSIRRIGLMPGRNASTVSREIKRNTWFPSNENESYRPKRLKTGPWTGRYYHRRPRAAQDRPQARQRHARQRRRVRPARASARQTARIAGPTWALHFQIDIGSWIPPIGGGNPRKHR